MPVNVIGTLKPKNNGKFPVAEAVDIKVTDDLRLDEALEKKADLKTIDFALNNKADKATTTSLQSQINEIITPVTQDAEVQNARVDAEGVTHTTLKERIDSTENTLSSLSATMFDIDDTAQIITEESPTAETYGTEGYVRASDGVFQTNSGIYTYLWTVPNDTELYIEALVDSGSSLYCAAVVYNTLVSTLPTTEQAASTIYVKGGSSNSGTLPTSSSKWMAYKNNTIAISINSNSHFILHYNGKKYFVNSDVLLSTAQIDQIIGSDAIASLDTSVTTLDTQVSELESGQSYKAENLRDVTAKEVILTGKNITNLETVWDDQEVVLLSRNRLDLPHYGTIDMNSYNSSYTITKINNGINIVSSTDDKTKSTAYARINYIAEVTGKIFVSCNAKIENSDNDNIRNLAIRVAIKKEGEESFKSQQIIKGTGLLCESVSVEKGDTIQIQLFAHVSSGFSATGTYIYDDIQIAYGGLYAYEKYSEDIPNVDKVAYSLPDDSNVMTNTTTNQSGKYRVTFDYLLPLAEFPANNDTLANVEVEGIDLITYNQTYQCVDGLGVSTTGKISVYMSNIAGKTELAAWLETHPVTIRYRNSSSSYAQIRHQFHEGEILVFVSTAQNVKYNYTPEKSKQKVVCFGDSITGMWDYDTGYPFMITHDSDLEAYNIGFSGSRYTDHADEKYMPFSMNRLVDAIVAEDFSLQDASSLVDPTVASYNKLYAEHLSALKSIDFTAVDYITLFYGVNDWVSNAPLKSEDDEHETNKQRTNIEDCVKYCISNLLDKYPHLRIIVITPYWAGFGPNEDSNLYPNGRGDYLYDYGNFIDEVARNSYNVPVLNLYRDICINSKNYYWHLFDNVHPNENTKHAIANRIINKINELR